MKHSITIELSEKEITEILKEYLSKEGFPVDNAKFKFEIGCEYYGYGLMETSVHRFKRCSVTIPGGVEK